MEPISQPVLESGHLSHVHPPAFGNPLPLPSLPFGYDFSDMWVYCTYFYSTLGLQVEQPHNCLLWLQMQIYMSCQWKFAFASFGHDFEAYQELAVQRQRWQHAGEGQGQDVLSSERAVHNPETSWLCAGWYLCQRQHQLCPICTSHSITQISLDLQSIAGNIHSIMTLTGHQLPRSIVTSRFNVIATMYCLCSSIANYARCSISNTENCLTLISFHCLTPLHSHIPEDTSLWCCLRCLVALPSL